MLLSTEAQFLRCLDRWHKTANHIPGGKHAWRSQLQYASCSCSAERCIHLRRVDIFSQARAVANCPSVYNARCSAARTTAVVWRTNTSGSRVRLPFHCISLSDRFNLFLSILMTIFPDKPGLASYTGTKDNGWKVKSGAFNVSYRQCQLHQC